MHLGEILDIQSPDILYVNHTNFFDIYWYKDSAGNHQINHDLISSFKKYKLIIFDMGSEHFGDPSRNLILDVYQNLELHGLNFILITHLPDQHNLFPRLKYCPNEYHTSRRFFYTSQKIDCKGKKTFTLSCLNHYSWNHRIYNYLQMQHKTWFGQVLLSMQFENCQQRSDAIELPKNVVDQWNILTKTQKSITLGDNHKNIWNLNNQALLDCCASLITETVVLPGIYLSEKTWKPIACGQWFFILGCPKTISHLRDLGVDVFDDIIDHRYDDETDFFLRVEKLHQSIDNFMHLDHADLWQATISRRELNQKKFLNGEFDKTYLSEIQSMIDKLQ